jgi:hypothetical protein
LFFSWDMSSFLHFHFHVAVADCTTYNLTLAAS